MSALWNETLAAVKIADDLARSSDLNTIRIDLYATLKADFGIPCTDKIYFFGSRTMGLATKNSDLDIYVDTGNHFFDFSEKPTNRVITEIIKLIRMLSKATNVWKIVNRAAGNVPIVTVEHKQTGIQCDINVSDGIGCAQNQIVNYLFQLQPIGRYMCICLRNIFERNQIHDYFRSHVTILMVIFYLQVQKLLPTIEYLQRYNYNGDMGPWMTVISKETLEENGMKTINLNAEELKKMVEGFFKYYFNFDYSNVVSPYLGKAVSFYMIERWMPSRYYNHVAYNTVSSHKPMVVQDFVQLNKNKAKLIPVASLIDFKRVCKKYETIH